MSKFYNKIQKPNERYVEDPTEAGPNAEQKRWEEEHLRKAMMHFGAEDAKARQKVSNKYRFKFWLICLISDNILNESDLFLFQTKDYEYVMDEEIEFVQALQMEGTRKDKVTYILMYWPILWFASLRFYSELYSTLLTFLLQDEPELSESEKKKLSIEETQKSLPIFPFKEDLLAAIEAHQVLIIEGETGSGKTTQIPQYLFHAVCNLTITKGILYLMK